MGSCRFPFWAHCEACSAKSFAYANALIFLHPFLEVLSARKESGYFSSACVSSWMGVATNNVITGADETHCSCVQVVGVDDEQPVRYSAKNALTTEAYQVV